MRHPVQSLLGLVVVTAVSSTGALAGQFKNLNNTANLPVGGQTTAVSSPQNTATSMELESYEFLTSAAISSWSCRILGNGTGQALNIRLIGLNGTIIQSCVAPAGGACSTPPVGLVGGHRFECLVATQFGAPVAAGSAYTMAVQRLVFLTAPEEAEAAPSGALVRKN